MAKIHGLTKDITGQKFGRITIVGLNPARKGARLQWNGLCECGNTIIATTNSLRSGFTKSCGCLQNETRSKTGLKHKQNLIGKEFGEWIVLAESNYRMKSSGTVFWICRCSCGFEAKVAASELTSGASKSCGHLRSTSAAEKKLMDALSDKFKTKIERRYIVETSMGLREYDGYAPEHNLLIESDGSYFHGHKMPKRVTENDKFKTAEAKRLGYRLLRVWNDSEQEAMDIVKNMEELHERYSTRTI